MQAISVIKKKNWTAVIKTNSFLVFIRSQLSAFVGTLADYFVMITLTEFANVHYTLSIVFGGLIGATVNFLINRYWAFSSATPYRSGLDLQMIKFASVAAGSITLKSSGTYLVTENFKLNYKFSRLILDAFVAYGFNFVLMKYWVFRKKDDVDNQCVI